MSLRVLFVCTGNSARSQMAESVLNRRGAGRYQAESAGSHPAAHVHPLAVDVLLRAGLGWSGRQPRGLDGVQREGWDLVITVCDQAKEACPVFLGRAVVEHWGLPDPAVVEGDEATRRAAFVETLALINRRVDDLLLRHGSLPAQTKR